MTAQILAHEPTTTPIDEMTFAAREAALISYNMTPAELEALAEEIMQDELCIEADAYLAAMSEFPCLYRYAKEWDIDARFDGNNIPF